eukprot:scaffold42188_cov63-Phaeocystis_antarctica.AAC.2
MAGRRYHSTSRGYLPAVVVGCASRARATAVVARAVAVAAAARVIVVAAAGPGGQAAAQAWWLAATEAVTRTAAAVAVWAGRRSSQASTRSPRSAQAGELVRERRRRRRARDVATAVLGARNVELDDFVEEAHRAEPHADGHKGPDEVDKDAEEHLQRLHGEAARRRAAARRIAASARQHAIDAIRHRRDGEGERGAKEQNAPAGVASLWDLLEEDGDGEERHHGRLEGGLEELEHAEEEAEVIKLLPLLLLLRGLPPLLLLLALTDLNRHIEILRLQNGLLSTQPAGFLAQLLLCLLRRNQAALHLRQLLDRIDQGVLGR